MEFDALDALALDAVRFTSARGERRLAAVVKVTFALVDGGDARLAEPLALFDDVPFEDNDERSLRLASDRAPAKARVDVLFTGGAYAPPLERVARRELRFAIEDARGSLLDRRLVAVGTRRRLPSGEGEIAPFSYLPIRFELAYGGASSRANPVGVGADPADPRLPNLVDPRAPKMPACLGPIAPGWWGRARHLGGTVPSALPSLVGVERDFFNAAPPDQQIEHLEGDEWIVLEGLHPTRQRVRSRLPGSIAHARFEGPRGALDVPLRLDTLFVDGDTLLCALTFRGDVAHEDEPTRLVATLAPLGREPRFGARTPLTPPPVVEAPRVAPVDDEAPPLSGYEPPRSVVPASVPPASLRAPDPDPVPTQLTFPPRDDESVPIDNESPFVVVTRRWQITPPKDVLVVIAKGTFDLVVDGPARRAEKQLPPSGDRHVGDDEEASLRYPSDFAVYKPKADVLLVGHAYPTRDPSARDAAAVARVKLSVGPLYRELVVLGDRQWDWSGEASAPAPFERMPLVWERAFGGKLSPDNPVGRGYRTGLLLPNLERMDARVRTTGDDVAPLCFAPIDPRWRPRASKLGTYDGAWLRERWPYHPVDFDHAHFNAAAPELQIPFPAGDERFSLSGVDPERPTLEGALPSVRPHVYAQRTREKGAAFFEIEMSLDTLWFDADARQLVLVFRGLVPVDDDEASDLARLFVVEAPVGEPPSKDVVRARFLAGLVAPRVASGVAANATTPAAALPPPPPGKPLTRAQALERLAASSLAGACLIDADLRDLDLSGRDLRGAYLSRAHLAGATLTGANLEGAVLAEVVAEGVSFAAANLSHVTLAGARLEGADFSGATLDHATFEGARADRAVFVGARAHGARFLRASLSDARFDGADLTSAELASSTLDRASFVEATLADARLYGVVASEASFERALLPRGRFDRAVLRRCSFKAVDATGSSWTKADLTSSSFFGARLDKAVFPRATLCSVILSQARARGALFRKANLASAQLLRCDAMQANFEGADLRGADLRGANLYQVETWKAKLDGSRLELAHVAGSQLERRI